MLLPSTDCSAQRRSSSTPKARTQFTFKDTEWHELILQVTTQHVEQRAPAHLANALARTSGQQQRSSHGQRRCNDLSSILDRPYGCARIRWVPPVKSIKTLVIVFAGAPMRCVQVCTLQKILSLLLSIIHLDSPSPQTFLAMCASTAAANDIPMRPQNTF